jgi:hypothetical protein
VWKYLVLSTWYQSPYEDPLPLLIEILNLCHYMHQNISRFYYFCAFLGNCSIASKALLSVGNTFHFTQKGFCFPKIQPFLSNPGIKFHYIFNFFFIFNISFFFLFYIPSLLPFWSVYALCHAPCAISTNQKQWKSFFFVYALCLCTLCDLNKSETERKLAFSR